MVGRRRRSNLARAILVSARMIRPFTAVFLALAWWFSPPQAATSAQRDVNAITAGLAADLPRLMQQARVPGLAIAVIDRGGVAWARGFGVMRAGGDAAVTESTRFEAASLSKPVTAYVALQLVDAGPARSAEAVLRSRRALQLFR